MFITSITMFILLDYGTSVSKYILRRDTISKHDLYVAPCAIIAQSHLGVIRQRSWCWRLKDSFWHHSVKDIDVWDHKFEQYYCLASECQQIEIFRITILKTISVWHKKVQNINVWVQNVKKIIVGDYNVEKNQCLGWEECWRKARSGSLFCGRVLRISSVPTLPSTG